MPDLMDSTPINTPTSAATTVGTLRADGVTVAQVIVSEQPLFARLDVIAAAIRESAKAELDEPLQTEMAEFLDILPELASAHHAQLIPLAEVAAAALTTEKPNVTLAKGIRENIERRLRRPAIFAFIRGGSPPTRVILGLGTLLYFFIPFAMVYLPRVMTQKEVLGIDSSMLLLVGLAGALGSIVSIMVRIQDFVVLKDTDPSVLFFTGFFKPVIGMSFALFVFAVLSSGLIPVTIEASKARYFFAALAFVSGFSERFASDVASRAEKVVIAAA